MDISVVIPAYNEEKNIPELYPQLVKVLKTLNKSFEIIFIDDGSTDNTFHQMKKIANKQVNVIKFRRNFGQTAAWDAGFKLAKGNLIITMDADLQSDPKDVPLLLNKLKKGYDVVSGWRFNRKDNFTKRFFSKISLKLRKIIIDDKIHDSGCSLKVYRKECVKNLELFGEMHRYIVEILALRGHKIAEVKVNHRARKYGKTKYNFIRLPKGLLDLMVVSFWQRYSARPIHLFGTLGIIMNLFGVIIGAYLLFIKFVYRSSIANRPLLMLAVLLIVLGIQFVIFGLIADILMRLYYQGDKKNYHIQEIIK